MALTSPLNGALLVAFTGTLLLTFNRSLDGPFLRPFLGSIRRLTLMVNNTGANDRQFSNRHALTQQRAIRTVTPTRYFGNRNCSTIYSTGDYD